MPSLNGLRDSAAKFPLSNSQHFKSCKCRRCCMTAHCSDVFVEACLTVIGGRFASNWLKLAAECSWCCILTAELHIRWAVAEQRIEARHRRGVAVQVCRSSWACRARMQVKRHSLPSCWKLCRCSAACAPRHPSLSSPSHPPKAWRINVTADRSQCNAVHQGIMTWASRASVRACRRSFSSLTSIFSFMATSYLCRSSSIVGSYCSPAASQVAERTLHQICCIAAEGLAVDCHVGASFASKQGRQECVHLGGQAWHEDILISPIAGVLAVQTIWQLFGASVWARLDAECAHACTQHPHHAIFSQPQRGQSTSKYNGLTQSLHLRP